jgi:hypothetical protein
MEVAENSAKQPAVAVAPIPADTVSEGAVAVADATMPNTSLSDDKSGDTAAAEAQGFLEPFNNLVNGIKQRGAHLRQYTIQHASPLILNNSGQILSAVHLASEILMLQAGGLEFFKNKRNGGKVNYIIDPIYNLGRGILGLDKNLGGKANQNHWGIRATAAGFLAWTIGTFVHDKHESDKEVFEDSSLFKESKLGYFKKRLVQAVNILDPSNKRQQIGFGVMFAGIFTALSGRSAIDGAGNFYLNKSRAIGGMITTLAGSSLWLSVTDQSAWSRYGSILWTRIPFICTSTYKMHSKTVPYRGQTSPEAVRLFEKANREWKYYAAGASGFQAGALGSYLIGGVEVKEDGTLITHDEAKIAGNKDGEKKKTSLHKDAEVISDTPKTTLQQGKREIKELQPSAPVTARAASA